MHLSKIFVVGDLVFINVPRSQLMIFGIVIGFKEYQYADDQLNACVLWHDTVISHVDVRFLHSNEGENT